MTCVETRGNICRSERGRGAMLSALKRSYEAEADCAFESVRAALGSPRSGAGARAHDERVRKLVERYARAVSNIEAVREIQRELRSGDEPRSP